ncbi:glycoside hydrolase family 18 protein, partial [Babjeviella inositovora NRRL Y-12698]
MQNYIDYQVYMTYDLHGSWDLNRDPQVKCHVNKTEIVDALKMLDKAGAQIGKTYGGLANYGRSFKLSNPSCNGVGCQFSGPGNSRGITNTPGVLADAEIIDIDASSAKNNRWNDGPSECTFMQYDGNSVVAWATNRNNLKNYFNHAGLKGSVLWVGNYFKHTAYTNDVPSDCHIYLDQDIENVVYQC